jgi:pyridoxamine 5'-phosphate oxidase
LDLSHLRHEYALESLEIDQVDASPFKQFEHWFQQATTAELLEPNAMTLATVGPGGAPAQRMVLLKYFDQQGFVFFTNYTSRKAQHMTGNAQVSLLFPWLVLQRQVEISGVAEKISAGETLRYFVTRPRGSRLGAWVSQQSEVITSRSILEMKMDEIKRRFADGEVPVPSFWGGYRVRPHRFEFWQGRPNRLHDRICYEQSEGQPWRRMRLAP